MLTGTPTAFMRWRRNYRFYTLAINCKPASTSQPRRSGMTASIRYSIKHAVISVLGYLPLWATRIHSGLKISESTGLMPSSKRKLQYWFLWFLQFYYCPGTGLHILIPMGLYLTTCGQRLKVSARPGLRLVEPTARWEDSLRLGECDMTNFYCSLQEIPIISYLPDS